MIGGKVLDASAIAAYARNDLAAVTWIDVARTMNFALGRLLRVDSTLDVDHI